MRNGAGAHSLSLGRVGSWILIPLWVSTVQVEPENDDIVAVNSIQLNSISIEPLCSAYKDDLSELEVSDGTLLKDKRVEDPLSRQARCMPDY